MRKTVNLQQGLHVTQWVKERWTNSWRQKTPSKFCLFSLHNKKMNSLPVRTGMASSYLRDGCPLMNLSPAAGEAAVTGDTHPRHGSCSQPRRGSAAAAAGSAFHGRSYIRGLPLYPRTLLFPSKKVYYSASSCHLVFSALWQGASISINTI